MKYLGIFKMSDARANIKNPLYNSPNPHLRVHILNMIFLVFLNLFNSFMSSDNKK